VFYTCPSNGPTKELDRNYLYRLTVSLVKNLFNEIKMPVVFVFMRDRLAIIRYK